MQQYQQSNGVFPGMLDASNQSSTPFDPSVNGMYNGNSFNPNQFQNPGMQQHVNPQTAFQNQTYNVGSVVPSKRPREEGMGMSPGPPQNNAMNASRSQTPMQQQGAPFQGGQQFHNPYQHLQQGSTNATPSPTMPNQQFRPPQPPPRMTTASPANFGQIGQNMPGQMPPSPHAGNPQMSPQVPQQNFSPNIGGGQGFGQQNFGNQGMMMPGQLSSTMAGTGMNMNPQMQAHLQQRQYQQRLLQQQQQRMQAQAQGMAGPQMGAHNMAGQGMPGQRPMGALPGQMFNPGGQPVQGTPNGQQQQPHAQQQMPQGQQNPTQQQEKARIWLQNLQAQSQAQGRPFNSAPMICGKPVNLYMLWYFIAQFGGSTVITQRNMWPMVAQRLNLANNPNAPQEVRQAFETYLSAYERSFMLAKQAQRQQHAQEAARQMAGVNGPQGSPNRQMPPSDGAQNQFAQGQQQPQQITSQPPQNAMQRPGSISMQNGLPAPTMPPTPQQNDIVQPKRTPSFTKAESMQPQEQPSASPAISNQQIPVGPGATPQIKREPSTTSVKPPVQDTEYTPQKHILQSYGGYDLNSLAGLTADLARRIPDIPVVFEMGVIDIHSLSLSLQCGQPHDVRRAIDDLVSITVDPRIMLELEKCEDLVDVLVDCAEVQIDQLAEEAAEVSDGVDLISYEDAIRCCRSEAEDLHDISEFGSVEHDLEQAAARLIALTTVLRNLSFNEHNHPFLATPSIISLLSNIIRLLGTRHMLLRTYQNVADFYKDTITFLSNIAQAVELPSRDDALHILHFMLAFAPQPPPTVKADRTVRFSPYNPLLHRYTAHAVDSLAKIFARQEPNRSLYRSIFSASPSSTEEVSPTDLLTRSFGLGICVLPDRSKLPISTTAELRLVEARKPLLSQGMLAADILATLVPTSSSSSESSNSSSESPPNLARAWLESDDRWATSLLRMAYVLSTDQTTKSASQQRQQITRMGSDGRMQHIEQDSVGYGTVVHRGLGMLNRLVEKAAAGGPNASSKSKSLSRSKTGLADLATGLDGDDVLGNGHVGETADEEDINDEEDYGEDDIRRRNLTIKGDPIPHRETVLGALLLQTADKEAVRMMGRLYDVVVST